MDLVYIALTVENVFLSYNMDCFIGL